MKKTNFILTMAFITQGVVCYAQSDSIQIPKMKPFQLSLIYPLSTEGIASKDFAYKTSLNALTGISKGINGVEASGFSNFTNGNVEGTQLAGFNNTVKGNVKGLQAAGFSNLCTENFVGAQLGGFSNINRKSFKGAQIGGFMNVNLNNLKGTQLAGFMNLNKGNVQGIQGSGFINLAKSVNGIQLAGFSNIADTVSTQISGFINVAKYVKNRQIGFINVCDSTQKAPIGFLSFVKNGYNKIEVEAGETFYLSVNGKVGSKKFYNMFTLGAKPTANQFIWTFGYGFGSQVFEKEKVAMNLDLTFGQMNENELWTSRMNLFNQFKVNFSYKLNDKITLYGGPTFQYYLQEKTDEFGNDISITDVSLLIIFDKIDNYYKHSAALGFNFGLRF